GQVPRDPDAEAQEPELPDPLLRRVLARCIDALPEQPRRVLGLRLASSGEGDAAMAQALNMRLNTFLQNFGRARKMLADCLAKGGVAVAEGLAR
ncbi:MAG TPA: hypothetical protein VM204_04080, partial [Gaiellaceae bacterium]|nr:hypothetical protein [Gaiellaceae bacterium]